LIKAFVTGWPVSHSLSPALHGFWLKRHGIAGSYEALPVSPEDFRTFLHDLPASGFVGGNVTIPHKEAAFAGCDVLDGEARAIGAVNTLWVEAGKVHGSCTDGYGFSANLDQYCPQWRDAKTALVIGAGGAARAVVHALLSGGIERVIVANRTRERAQALIANFQGNLQACGWQDIPDALPDAGLVVNTTSLGMKGHGGDEAWIDLAQARDDAIVTDIVYVPLETPFLRSARRRDLVTVDGLGMLLHQAVPGFERWFGVRPRVDAALREHMLAVLAARERQP
jgi:shikimate dehydrogenase